MDSKETILLFGLSEAETIIVRRLISSFEIEAIPLSIQKTRDFVQTNPNKKICLVLFHIDKTHPKQDRVIKLLRDFVGALVPILILVPKKNHGDIKKYISAGADDFIEFPLNEDRFSISFLVLLEMGQIIASSKGPETDKEERGEQEEDGWNRVINYFQEGLSYFAPKSLLHGSRAEPIFDKWQQVKRLGVGGFGVVWLVKEVRTNKLAVAKIPHQPQMNIRVLRSAAILKRLVHHPNIVHLIEIVKEGGKLILIQEYVAGPTLQTLLEKGISRLEKENYFLQLLSVVSYAHKHKILHRDIKPENILIKKEGQVKLLDFGIARDLSWQTSGSSSEGTVNFVPPEQFEGKSCIASDVWALGVILFIFATGDVPYSQELGEYPLDIETAVKSRAPRKINPAIDRELERIIMTCLQKDLSKRYSNASELLDDLSSVHPNFGRGTVLPENPTPQS